MIKTKQQMKQILGKRSNLQIKWLSEFMTVRSKIASPQKWYLNLLYLLEELSEECEVDEWSETGEVDEGRKVNNAKKYTQS